MTPLSWILGITLLLPVADPPAPEYPFAVTVTGKGKPMILLPGLGCSGEVWDATVEHFKDRYECHVLTLAGFAGQPPLKEDVPYCEAVAKGIARYARDKKLESPVIVGHSLGAHLAFKLAASEPELVGPIIAVDGFPAPTVLFAPNSTDRQRKAVTNGYLKKYSNAEGEQYHKRMREFFGQLLAGEQLDTVMQWVAASDRPTLLTAMREALLGDTRAGLEKVKSPVLVLGAYHKGLSVLIPTKAEFEKRLAMQVEMVKGAKIAVRENCKHFVMYEDPKWLHEQMETVLGMK